MTGNSLCSIMETGIRLRKVFGFDSFEGLPAEFNDKFNSADWTPGAFNISKKLNVTKEKAIQMLQQRFDLYHYDVHLIPGFYQNSLKDEIVSLYDMQPASFVNVDVDIYTSTIECLDFMFRNKLIVPGTIIRYDDWGGSLMNAPEFCTGESRAHKEILAKYNIKAECLYKVGSPPHIVAIWRIL